MQILILSELTEFLFMAGTMLEAGDTIIYKMRNSLVGLMV